MKKVYRIHRVTEFNDGYYEYTVENAAGDILYRSGPTDRLSAYKEMMVAADCSSYLDDFTEEIELEKIA